MSVDGRTLKWAAMQPKKLVAIKVIYKSDKGNILLVKPTFKTGWQLPGGGVDALESPEEAAIREMREELHIKILPTDLKIVGMVQRKDFDNLIIVFEVNGSIPEVQKLRIQEAELEAYRYEVPDKVASQISDYYQELWVRYLTVR